MPRLRLYDLRNSRLPGLIGQCTANTAELCSYVNAAQERLLFCKEAGDEGWYGTWAEVGFNVSRASPYLTLPRELARMESVVLCNRPIPINNQFFEYLDFGSGRMPQLFRQCHPNCLTQSFNRNNVCTFNDLTNAPQQLRFYISNEADVGSRIFVSGLDQNSKEIWGLDGAERVNGVFYAFAEPFTDTTEQFTRLSGFQKDQTLGPVEVWQVDPTTGDEVKLLIMQPNETSANYTRYYFGNLPNDCCGRNSEEAQTLQVRALCKLQPIPVTTDTDYLVIQNLQALIHECNAVRYSEMDTAGAKQLEQNEHRKAVQYLNGELTHYYGLTNPAVGVYPYGSADLRKQCIGTMI